MTPPPAPCWTGCAGGSYRQAEEDSSEDERRQPSTSIRRGFTARQKDSDDESSDFDD
jgi:hypothetical protein